jgi:MFS family permease
MNPKILRLQAMAMFFVHAVTIGAIHTRIPDIQLQIGLSESQLGIALMGQPLGALCMFLFSSRIIERFGPHAVTLSMLPVAATLAALATIVASPILLFVLLALNGMAFSLTNISVNVEADRVEAATGMRVMNSCHGAWSLGFLGTALLGAAMRGLGVSPATHLFVLLPVSVILVLAVMLPMPVVPARPHAGMSRQTFAWPTWLTMGLVGVALGAALTEGASRAWSIIFLRDNFDVAPWVESLALPALLATMACGRLIADRWVDHFGPVRIARTLASVAICGLALIVLAQSAYWALAGFALVGIGICVIYPLAISAAARLGDRPASQNVASLTLIFQMVNLCSPVIIGAIAENFGMRIAFGLFLPLMAMTFLMAGRLSPRSTSPA